MAETDSSSHLLRAGSVSLEPADAGSDEAREVVRRYFGDIGTRFTEPLDVTSYAASDADEMSPPDGCFLLARAGGLVVGCGGLRRHAATVGEVKRMWVEPGWRGLGLATRLLHALEDQARRTGYREVYLDTHVSLVEAQAMYRALGYRAIDRYNDNPHAGHWFAKTL